MSDVYVRYFVYIRHVSTSEISTFGLESFEKITSSWIFGKHLCYNNNSYITLSFVTVYIAQCISNKNEIFKAV